MLADKVYELASFQRQYEALFTLSICNTISNLEWRVKRADLLAKIDWNNVLSIASILSYAENSDHHEVALRIAQTCLEIEETNEIQKNASAIILENLTNKPAIDIALRKMYLKEGFRSNYPIAFQLQVMKSEIENSIILSNNILNLNKFQKDVYEEYENNSTISISAPTSAGKSFILTTIIAEELLTGKKNIVYIVPTRALISQVESDIRLCIKKHSIQGVNVSTVPQGEVSSVDSNVFVFTQERLHWFLIENLNFNVDLLIIDEAHKIEDGNRGILLQQKIEEVVLKYPTVRVLFSSPFSANPEILFDNFKNATKKKIVDTHFSAVNQNLIFCKQVRGNRNEWEFCLPYNDKKISIGTIRLNDRATTELKKISFIAHAISVSKSGNMIYANSPSEAEKTASILYDLLSENTNSEQIFDLIKLIKKSIHTDYLLAKVLKKKIAFHYGNMPLLIRQEIEKLFKSGEIKYLICTSTLLEGVNLPAKSIFIRKPTRGRTHPLGSSDFWNLAGRAGRWGVEFSGNIVCIEPDLWTNPPTFRKTKQLINRAVDKIEANGVELINFIKNGSPREIADERQDLESAFGYYYIQYLNNNLPNDRDFYNELIIEFARIQETITVPDDILKRNPGISPIAQQKLFEYMQSMIDNLDELIPLYPENKESVNGYTKLIERIGKTLSYYHPKLNTSRAILIVNWMKGRPLSFLISSSEKNYKKKENPKSVQSIIRETMEQVENFARFQFAKDSSCYVDILRYFLRINQRDDLVDKIPQLNLWLEFGVSQKTHLSLLSIGLSRNAVIELSEYITNTQMTKEECLDWLKEQDFNQFEISPIIKNELISLL